MKSIFSFCAAAILFSASLNAEDQGRIEIDNSAEGPGLNPHMYGIFLEELGHSCDGGLYAEMVQNRSFEDSNIPEGMRIEGNFAVAKCRDKIPWPPKEPVPAWSNANTGDGSSTMILDKTKRLNPVQETSLRLEIKKASAGNLAGIANTGYWGMSFKADAAYRLRFSAVAALDFKGRITAVLEDESGRALSEPAVISGIGSEWNLFSSTLTAKETNHKGRLAIYADAPGTLWLDVVSLFPADTFNGRANGLRADLAQMLKDLKPGFLRFPGGCVTEGLTLEQGFAWKKTIGDIAERPGVWNAMWGYRRTDGIGMLEYLQLAEDIGAVSLFCNNMGIACTIHTQGGVPCPADQVQSYVDDTVDAISYATDPVTEKWGALRQKHGHPGPFEVPYVNIGNELNCKEYTERYPAFYRAVKEKDKSITCIAYAPVGRPKAKVEIKDVHDYRDEKWFMDNMGRFDSYDRKEPRISNMEIALRSQNLNHTLKSALVEAAYMIGLERNADVVRLVSYAPLMANVNHTGKWEPVLIYFDNHRAYAIPSYYTQMLFMHHRPDVVLATRSAGTGKKDLFALAGKLRATGEIIVKIVNLSENTRRMEISLKQDMELQDEAEEWVLSARDPMARNSFCEPLNVAPVRQKASISGNPFAIDAPAYSFIVLRLKPK